MSLRSPNNPKEFRTALHTFYEEYAQGTVNFPGIRLVGKPQAVEDLPRKTRPIARALIGAWDLIDTGRKVHNALVDYHLENPHDTLVKGTGAGMVIGSVGRNVLELALFAPTEDGEFAVQNIIVGPRPVRDGFLAESKIKLVDGRLVDAGIFGGDMQPDFELPIRVGNIGMQITHFDTVSHPVA